MGIVSGKSTGYAVYALGNDGNLSRLLSDASMAGQIVPGGTPAIFTTGAQLFLTPGTDTVWVNTGTKLFTYNDTIVTAVPNVAVASFTTTTANVTFGAVTGATKYTAVVTAGSTGAKDVYSAANPALVAVAVDNTAMTATFSGLTNNTTYTVSVWATSPVTSFVGTKTFSTQPSVVGVPVNLAPAAGSTGIAITPGFAWGAVTGATSYTVEVSTSSTFATLVGTKQTTTVPAFAWTTPALAYNTTYYWRVVAITPTGSSDPVVSVFTTLTAPPTSGTTQPPVTVTNTTVTLTTPTAATPAYIWAIIGIGALLVIVVIVLIVRTRRVA